MHLTQTASKTNLYSKCFSNLNYMHLSNGLGISSTEILFVKQCAMYRMIGDGKENLEHNKTF